MDFIRLMFLLMYLSSVSYNYAERRNAEDVGILKCEINFFFLDVSGHVLNYNLRLIFHIPRPYLTAYNHINKTITLVQRNLPRIRKALHRIFPHCYSFAYPFLLK